MAEALDIETETKLQQAVNCPVCFESMTDSRTLIPCMHTFCADCVTKLDQISKHSVQGILCPLCRTFIVPDGIRPNPFVSSVVEMILQQDAASKKKEDKSECMQCGSSEITVRCLHCDDYLCDNCKGRHQRIKGFQDHKIVGMDDSKGLQIKNISALCTKHPAREIERNCIACNQAVCSECLYKDHNGHKSESIDEALSKIRPDVKQALFEMNRKINNRKGILASLVGGIEDVKENKVMLMNQLHTQKESISKQFLEKVDQEYQHLLSYLESNSGTQIKEMELMKHDMENSVVSDESVLTWVMTILDKTDGGGLLRELQSGLMTRIKQLPEQPKCEVVVKQLRLVSPNIQLTQQPLLGEIKLQQSGVPNNGMLDQQNTASTRPVNDSVLYSEVVTTAKSPPGASIRGYRITGTNLISLKSKLRKERTVKLNTTSQRLCLFRKQLWMPCRFDKSIKVMALDNMKEIQTIKMEFVSEPHSIHPVGSDVLVLAAKSGLYILEHTNSFQVKGKLLEGCFHDVHADRQLLAALAGDDKKVYLLDRIGNNWKMRNSFSVPINKGYTNTVHVSPPHVYVSDRGGNRILKYTLKGEQLGQYGGANTTLSRPKLCISDEKHNLLIAESDSNNLTDVGSNNLLVLSDTGSLIHKIHVEGRPWDAIIVDDSLYVLDYHDNITIYKI